VLATDWENLTVAGAFIVGVVLGSLATIRVMRVVFGYIEPWRSRRGAQKPPPDPGEGSDGG
jgi:hypothetical protein